MSASLFGGVDYNKIANAVSSATAQMSGNVADIDSKLTAPASLMTVRILINNSSGTTALSTALFPTSTPSKYAVIYYPTQLVLDNFSTVSQSTAPAILIGNSSAQQKTLFPGDKLETFVQDLSVIYVKVPAGASIYLEVVYEV